MDKLEWRAMCFHPDCRNDKLYKLLEKAPNGCWVEAAAKIHRRDNPSHYVVVAYEVE